MLIGVDIDGVISDSYPVWLQELNLHYGKNITVLTDYEIHLVFDVPWDDMNNFFVQNSERLLFMPKPVPGAKEGIEALIREGHKIVYVTARTPEEEEVTLRWLNKNQIPHEKVLFTAFKSKVDLVKQWGIEVFIEDYQVNAQKIAESGVPVFLLDSTYNQGELAAGVKRCMNWEEILKEIQAIR